MSRLPEPHVLSEPECRRLIALKDEIRRLAKSVQLREEIYGSSERRRMDRRARHVVNGLHYCANRIGNLTGRLP
jgi:hypothetical protein